MPDDGLNKSINDIEVDLSFKAQAKKMGISTLRDIMAMGISKLKAHPEFTYIWYTDMLQILKQENLLDLFQNQLLKEGK